MDNPLSTGWILVSTIKESFHIPKMCHLWIIASHEKKNCIRDQNFLNLRFVVKLYNLLCSCQYLYQNFCINLYYLFFKILGLWSRPGSKCWLFSSQYLYYFSEFLPQFVPFFWIFASICTIFLNFCINLYYFSKS